MRENILRKADPHGLKRKHPDGEDLEHKDARMQAIFRQRQIIHLTEALDKAKAKDGGFVDLTED